MSIKVTILFPNVNNVHEIEPLITDIGELLDREGFSNKSELSDAVALNSLNSIIIINDDEDNIATKLENKDEIIIIPIKEKN